MRVEEMALRSEIRQMLNEAGFNKNTLPVAKTFWNGKTIKLKMSITAVNFFINILLNYP